VNPRSSWSRLLPPLVAGFTLAILAAAVISIILTAAGPEGMSLSPERASAWIAALYSLPMIPSLILTIRYRTPFAFTGNIFALLFFASLGARVGFPELAGAAMVAGAIVLVTTVLGLTERIGRWIPTPIVQGLIAGAVLPFVIDIFSAMTTTGTATGVEVSVTVASVLIAFLGAERFVPRVPALVPAFGVGFVAAAATGLLGELPNLFAFPHLAVIRPAFSWSAVLTVTPVLVAVMTVQSNVPALIYLRGEGYEPPERLVHGLAGAGTIVASLFGPVMVSLSLPATLLSAGPTAGEREVRHVSIYLPAAFSLAIALFAGTAAELATFVPPVLLLAFAGLALIPALVAALRGVTAGPLVLGPIFALAIAMSEISLFDLGPFFWALLIGTAVSVAFERRALAELRAAGSPRPRT
jgi:benzoate membrane transport protein